MGARAPLIRRVTVSVLHSVKDTVLSPVSWVHASLLRNTQPHLHVNTSISFSNVSKKFFMLLFPALLIICGIPLFFLNIAYIKSRDLNVGLLVLLKPLFIQQFSRVF